MEKIKFQGHAVNGDKVSTLKWSPTTDKDELLAEVFTSEELFEDLSTYWKELEKRSDCEVSMSYDWAYRWWKYFGKTKQRSLYILTFWDGTKLVGLAPFYKGYSTFGSLILETNLQLIGSCESSKDQNPDITSNLDIVVDRSYTDVVAELLADILTPEFLEVDIIKFHHVSDSSFIMNYLYPKLEDRIEGIMLEHTGTSSYIDLIQQEKSLKENIKDQKSNGRPANQSFHDNQWDKEFVIQDTTTSWQNIEKEIDRVIELYLSNRTNRFGSKGVFDEENFVKFLKDIVKSASDNNSLWFKQAFPEQGVRDSKIAVKYKQSYYDFFNGLNERHSSSTDYLDSSLLMNLVEDGISSGTERIELLRSENHSIDNVVVDSFKKWKLTIPLRDERSNVLRLLNWIKVNLL
jgi:hypothetical protein